MKNILFITNLYPSIDVELLNNTSVCHYYVKEWLKLGYNVRVIHNYNLYPKFYYPILQSQKKFFANKYGIAILDKYLDKMYTYYYEDVKVTRIPIYKFWPGGQFSQKTINKQVSLIKEVLDNENFTPDIIVGHFIHPTLEILVKLKDLYRKRVSLCLHGKPNKYNKKEHELLSYMDYIGFRSYAIKNAFEKLYGINRSTFMCPSGVPESFCEVSNVHNYKTPLKIIYVGNLIKRKHPAAIISAISLLDKHNFHVTYVGDGEERSRIMKIAKNSNLSSSIEIVGRVPRQEVVDYLDSADIFVMVSENETFGLVYLEAMARGCIVVASTDEGMDGIIEHGVNGFLCEAGNEYALADILYLIEKLSTEELKKLSDNSRETARKYTDTSVAKHYLNALQI